MSATHTLRGEAASRRVWMDEVELNPKPSQKLRNHSPDGFNWGYGGSGSAQLALAIMLELGNGLDDYQEFKFMVIARLPMGQDFDVKFNTDEGIISEEKEGSHGF